MDMDNGSIAARLAKITSKAKKYATIEADYDKALRTINRQRCRIEELERYSAQQTKDAASQADAWHKAQEELADLRKIRDAVAHLLEVTPERQAPVVQDDPKVTLRPSEDAVRQRGLDVGAVFSDFAKRRRAEREAKETDYERRCREMEAEARERGIQKRVCNIASSKAGLRFYLIARHIGRKTFCNADVEPILRKHAPPCTLEPTYATWASSQVYRDRLTRVYRGHYKMSDTAWRAALHYAALHNLPALPAWSEVKP